ncbi:MAG: hypothetical protein FJ405_16730, partial [Verrucomicrobia bacterium]|nr:hypothetical protein [Verrucomicrobiota bacterium]
MTHSLSALVRLKGCFSRASSVALLLGFVLSSTAAEPGKIRFNRDIRPILSENCLACHGPDPLSRKAGL